MAGMIAADVNTLLPDDFLVKVDRASMACGLEVRPPLVDHEFLELSAGMPSSLKVHRGETKWVLKQAYADDLPPGITTRAKHGFEIPVNQWLRGPLRQIVESAVLVTGGSLEGLVDVRAARTAYRQHLTGSGLHGSTLWTLLVLARWVERYGAIRGAP